MDKKYTMADLLAECGDRFDILEEIKKENKKLYHPEEFTEEQSKVEEIKEIEEQLSEKKEKDDKPKDITIKCKKCEQDWIWTVAEQQFYKEKGFYKPSLCKDCRKKMKVVNNFHKS